MRDIDEVEETSDEIGGRGISEQPERGRK